MKTPHEAQQCCEVRVMSNCCGPDSSAFHRRFRTDEERRQEMERYRDQLKKGLDGVEERIRDLESKQSAGRRRGG